MLFPRKARRLSARIFLSYEEIPEGICYDLSVNAITANAIKHGMITYKNGLGIDRLGMNHSTL